MVEHSPMLQILRPEEVVQVYQGPLSGIPISQAPRDLPLELSPLLLREPPETVWRLVLDLPTDFHKGR